MRKEFLARVLVGLLAAVAIGAWVAVRWLAPAGGVELRARMPENGGWSREVLHAVAGEPLTLRLTSDDVVHGFAVGKTDFEPVEVMPAEWQDVTLTFDRPGTYTFYCTRWCGPNHWRMRGTIEVTGDPDGTPAAVEPPLFLQLGLDLDAHRVPRVLPEAVPDANRGAILAGRLPAEWLAPGALRTLSPEQVWTELRADPALMDLTGGDLWDLTAYAWQQAAASGAIEGEAIYRENCAACHGEAGQGDGVITRGLPTMDEVTEMGHDLLRPPDFTHPGVLTSASPALLEGKIIRGGMGTGMPYWGPILTDEQIQAVSLYLYQFAMDW